MIQRDAGRVGTGSHSFQGDIRMEPPDQKYRDDGKSREDSEPQDRPPRRGIEKRCDAGHGSFSARAGGLNAAAGISALISTLLKRTWIFPSSLIASIRRGQTWVLDSA